MSRRVGNTEIGFGSDSFLDIIANIVGILIILTVFASEQAAKTPVEAKEITEVVATEAHNQVELSEKEIDVTSPIDETPPLPLMSLTPPPVPQKLLRPSPELIERNQNLAVEIASLKESQSKRESQLRDLQDQNNEIRNRENLAVAALQKEKNEAKNREQQLRRFAETLQDAEKKRQRLARDVEQTEKAKQPVEKVKHLVTPVSQLVQGKEIHFRLLENEVAYVPVEELVLRMRPQIERQKQWLIKYRSHQGKVGPVDGFSMQYVVERQPVSIVEELRGRPGMMRIGVSQWKILAEPELQTETAEQALRADSAFARVLNMADADATLTFWVYPDSFPIYRKLRSFAYEDGFLVAARPLPFDVPIAGSPHGSRSTGQ